MWNCGQLWEEISCVILHWRTIFCMDLLFIMLWILEVFSTELRNVTSGSKTVCTILYWINEPCPPWWSLLELKYWHPIILVKSLQLIWRLDVYSLAPGEFEWYFRYLIFQIISVVDGWAISCEVALRWMSLDLTDDKSTLVQVMAWCRQATCHYLSQCYPRALSPYGVTRPQWVNT